MADSILIFNKTGGAVQVVGANGEDPVELVGADGLLLDEQSFPAAGGKVEILIRRSEDYDLMLHLIPAGSDGEPGAGGALVVDPDGGGIGFD